MDVFAQVHHPRRYWRLHSGSLRQGTVDATYTRNYAPTEVIDALFTGVFARVPRRRRYYHWQGRSLRWGTVNATYIALPGLHITRTTYEKHKNQKHKCKGVGGMGGSPSIIGFPKTDGEGFPFLSTVTRVILGFQQSRPFRIATIHWLSDWWPWDDSGDRLHWPCV